MGQEELVMSVKRGPMLIPYYFVLPQMVLVVVFGIFPFIYNFTLAMREFTLAGSRFVGFTQFWNLVRDPVFRTAVMNTLYYALVAIPFTLGFALLAAAAVNQKIRCLGVFRTSYLLPYTLSWAVVGLIWRWIFSDNYGILNHILELVGLPTLRWFLDHRLAIPCIAIASIWHDVGYYMVIFLAGLQSISPVYYEAADIDGAGTWGKFRFITVPLLRPMTLLVLTLMTINSFKIFDQVYVMTGGGPGRASLMLVQYIYDAAINQMRLGYASAAAVLLFLGVFGLTLIQLRVLGERS